MYFDSLLRTQFGKPSGLMGSLFMGPLLNVANKRLMSASIEMLEVRPRDVVLDVGFGGGYSLFSMADRATRGRIDGIDYSPEMVSAADRAIARRKLQGRIRVRCGDVMALPFQRGAFDKALTVNSIYYWPELLEGLREMARVLKRRGRMAVGFRPPITLRPFTLGWKGFHLYEPEEVAARMGQIDMDVVSVARTDQWLPLDGVVVVGQRK